MAIAHQQDSKFKGKGWIIVALFLKVLWLSDVVDAFMSHGVPRPSLLTYAKTSENNSRLCCATTALKSEDDIKFDQTVQSVVTNIATHCRESSLSIKENSIASQQFDGFPTMGFLKSKLTQMGMMAYISGMCIALPLILLPPITLYKCRLITTIQREKISLKAGQFCSRWLMRLIPFAKIKVINPSRKPTKDPSVWVCNHMSMLDVFFLLAVKNRLSARPTKIVYWKGLESNPVTRILFKACGFIPVDMADNGHGSANEYDKGSFKALLKGAKKAFEEGFDLGILPEGQLNPHPENGLSPVFTGAYTLAKLSKRPIRMMALHGTNHLWHPNEVRGMKCSGRTVTIRMYPEPLKFDNATHFSDTFSKIVGYFGAKGEDLPEVELQTVLDEASFKRRNESELS